MPHRPVILASPFADALSRVRHVFVDGLEVKAVVGVHEHEKRAGQRLIVSIDLAVEEADETIADRLENVVDYEKIVRKTEAICQRGHVNLIETLAERIAEACLEDKRILSARVRLEKPDAFKEARSVGIEIERLRSD
jgi:7,8-dihydroneopterin aldolase/epimerase/oxygenase